MDGVPISQTLDRLGSLKLGLRSLTKDGVSISQRSCPRRL